MMPEDWAEAGSTEIRASAAREVTLKEPAIIRSLLFIGRRRSGPRVCWGSSALRVMSIGPGGRVIRKLLNRWGMVNDTSREVESGEWGKRNFRFPPVYSAFRAHMARKSRRAKGRTLHCLLAAVDF